MIEEWVKQTMVPFKNRPIFLWKKVSQKFLLTFSIILFLFFCIGIVTSTNLSPKHSSLFFTTWTSNIEKHIFTTLLASEQKGISFVDQIEIVDVKWSEAAFHLLTSVQINDFKSLLRYELPGFSTFEHRIVIAGIGMDEYVPLAHESGPPLEDVLDDKEAIDPNDGETHDPERPPLATDEQVVFIYNSHNRESFLPHLPNETNPDRAYHQTVNITKVSDRFASTLEKYGIRALVDKTDIMSILHHNNWKYSQSYRASRPVVQDVLKQNDEIRYVFDLHRDSLPRKQTTTTINGEDVAQILFIVGGENKQYEKNLKLATGIHYLLEESYPGVSKGVVTKSGPKVDGVYNQDLLETSLLIEIGGYDNHLEELYRAADILAESFSSYYWEAEKVTKEVEK